MRSAESGFRVDDVTIDGAVDRRRRDGRPRAGRFDGFLRTTGAEVESFFNAYVVENRQYDGYDTSLRTAYNFGFLDTPAGLGGDATRTRTAC